MLRSGLSQCSVIDPSWISETSYWSNMNDSSSNSFNSYQYSLEGSLTKISGQVSEQNTDSTLNKVSFLVCVQEHLHLLWFSMKNCDVKYCR